MIKDYLAEEEILKG